MPYRQGGQEGSEYSESMMPLHHLLSHPSGYHRSRARAQFRKILHHSNCLHPTVSVESIDELAGQAQSAGKITDSELLKKAIKWGNLKKVESLIEQKPELLR